MEILGSKTSNTEFKGRFIFLKKIVYHANIYECSRLLQYYAAWLRLIEMGLNTWKDDLAQTEPAMLAGSTNYKESLPKSDKFDGVWISIIKNVRIKHSHIIRLSWVIPEMFVTFVALVGGLTKSSSRIQNPQLHIHIGLDYLQSVSIVRRRLSITTYIVFENVCFGVKLPASPETRKIFSDNNCTFFFILKPFILRWRVPHSSTIKYRILGLIILNDAKFL